MIPKINNRGHSFKGVTAYLMHDKNAQTNERVGWSETGNLHTNDIEKAALVMAWTDRNADILKRDFGGSQAGRKSEAGAVYHYSLSWAQGEQPDPQHQKIQAHETLERLGLKEHQYYMVAHNDTDHAHIHIVANLTNPETGKRHTPSFDKRELQAWALDYERTHVLHCQKREENAAKREQGQQLKNQDKKQDYSEKITRAYHASDNGQAFINALHEEGLELAKARRGNNFVVVDEKGDIQKLSRQLDIEAKGKEKSAVIQNLLKDINREKIQDAEILAKEIKETREQQQQHYDRDAEELKQQNALYDAAEQAASAIAKQQIEEQKAEKQAQKILNNERKASKLLKSKRIEILTRAKADWQSIKAQQSQEKQDLTQTLKDVDSREEKAHRQHWQPIINQEQQRKEKLQAQLDKKGISGAYYRARHGEKAREEIKAINQNINNATMRLEERLGGLNRQDKFMLGKLNKEHYLQRSELKNRIDAELEQLKESSPKKSAGNAPENNEIKGMAKRKTKKNVSSLEEWESNARVNDAIAAATKAEQKNIPIEALRRQEEQQRQGAQFEAPKNTLEKNNANVEHDFNQSSSNDYHADQWEEMVEVFAERQEEIENNIDYSEEEREQAIYDLENEYYEAQNEYDNTIEQSYEQDQGIER